MEFFQSVANFFTTVGDMASQCIEFVKYVLTNIPATFNALNACFPDWIIPFCLTSIGVVVAFRIWKG